VIDCAETAIMADRVGEHFAAVVTDQGEGGARIQLCDVPVVARTTARGEQPGARIRVRLDSADPASRQLSFTRVE
jgi:RNase II-type exonuclease C-terminal S1 domain